VDAYVSAVVIASTKKNYIILLIKLPLALYFSS